MKGYKNESVLNTDSFDKRRFKKIFDMSQGLKKLSVDGELPTFEPLLGDIWGSLFKMKPEITEEEVPEYLQPNRSLMEKIMNDESFEDYREFTRLDDLSSAIGTIKFGEKTNEWIKEQKERDEELRKQMEELQRLQNQLQKQERQNGAGNGNQQLQQDIQKAMGDLNQHLQKSLQNNSHNFSQAMAQAMQETQQTKENLKSLLGGTNAGSGDAELKKVPLREQISLAEKIAHNAKMKQIAEWAGRFKQIARKKQKSKHDESIERSGVTLGNEIDRILPMELAMYSNSATKNDFLRRFAEGEVMQYEQKGKEQLGKGPIVLCLDQSGSMDHLDTQSKGFALALMSIARKQRRDFALILFSNKIKTHLYERGRISTKDMVKIAQTFLNGGTNFERPLKESLEVINKSRFKNADVIFVTDGEDNVRGPFLERFDEKKKEKKFNVLSLVIGERDRTVKQFSDKVIRIKSFNDKGSFEAFEI